VWFFVVVVVVVVVVYGFGRLFDYYAWLLFELCLIIKKTRLIIL
jgi:hypothetical protein